MNKTIRILVVNDQEVVKMLAELGLNNVTAVKDSKAAIKEYVEEYKKNPYDLTLINDLPDNSEIELLKSIIEIAPDHYVVMLCANLTSDKILNSIRSGAGGVLNHPVTANKLRMELEKYALLRENKKEAYM